MHYIFDIQVEGEEEMQSAGEGKTREGNGRKQIVYSLSSVTYRV